MRRISHDGLGLCVCVCVYESKMSWLMVCRAGISRACMLGKVMLCQIIRMLHASLLARIHCMNPLYASSGLSVDLREKTKSSLDPSCISFGGKI